MVFSDESAFKTISHRQKLVRRPLGADRFNSHYTVKAVKFPAGVMVWACFSGEKVSGGLYFLNKKLNMNAALYVNVVENYMLPFYTTHENAHFLQDDNRGMEINIVVKATRKLKGSQEEEEAAESPRVSTSFVADLISA
ncbi:Transposable element Tcb2 transposase [Portunus trituberculatus]|uniref:Transposable element Tcb2 transposase n=1 Tax=Portunus trituberculatus TaxID=210409 RepID=A0A5B7HKC3_PORTR|nr:Transposable element Tcb2 transposase [Portunus trituberculatus]